MNTSVQRRNVIILAVCQGLMMIATTTMIAEAALVGHRLAHDKLWATLPAAAMQIGVMVTMFPASLLMQSIGRRPGFTIGAGFGIAGAAVSFLGVTESSFWTFSLGTFLMGCYNGFAQFYRFAAADVAESGWRARAISYVLAGGVIAALVGPELAKSTKDIFPDHVFAGSFAALAAVGLLAAALLQFLDIPRLPADQAQQAGRPFGEIARQPVFLVAILGGIVGYAGMTFIMTATPLAMVGHQHHFDAAASVIQWHVFAMFAPSFITGHLIHRIGVLGVMQIGAALLLACAQINAAGTTYGYFWVALVLLGLGWNFLYISATTLLTEAYRPGERAVTQAANDCLVFGSVTIASLSSGAVLHAFDWDMVNAAVVPFALVTLGATFWLQRRRAAQSAVGAAGK